MNINKTLRVNMEKQRTTEEATFRILTNSGECSYLTSRPTIKCQHYRESGASERIKIDESDTIIARELFQRNRGN